MTLDEMQAKRLRIVGALRSISAEIDKADEAGNEAEYDRLNALRLSTGNTLDAVLVQIERAILAGLVSSFDVGPFAPSFQVVGPHAGEWLIAEPAEMRIACRMNNKADAETRAKEMCHFRNARRAAERQNNKPINLSTCRH